MPHVGHTPPTTATALSQQQHAMRRLCPCRFRRRDGGDGGLAARPWRHGWRPQAPGPSRQETRRTSSPYKGSASNGAPLGACHTQAAMAGRSSGMCCRSIRQSSTLIAAREARRARRPQHELSVSRSDASSRSIACEQAGTVHAARHRVLVERLVQHALLRIIFIGYTI